MFDFRLPGKSIELMGFFSSERSRFLAVNVFSRCDRFLDAGSAELGCL